MHCLPRYTAVQNTMAKAKKLYCGDFDDHLHLQKTVPHLGMFATCKFGIMLRPYRVVWMSHLSHKALLWPCGEDGLLRQTFRYRAVMIQQRATDEKWYECDVSLPNKNAVQLDVGIWRD